MECQQTKVTVLSGGERWKCDPRPGMEMFAAPDWKVSDWWVVLLSLDNYRE